jgi:hypothetical protein
MQENFALYWHEQAARGRRKALMTQSFWESEEAAVEQKPVQTEAESVSFEPEQMEEQAEVIQTEEQEELQESMAGVEPVAVQLSADEFTALEDRILRAVELVKKERRARQEAEDRATVAEAQWVEQAAELDLVKAELDHTKKESEALRGERDQVKQRVERLLSQLDSLEL